MKVIIAALALVAVVAAVPVEYEKRQPPQIISYQNSQDIGEGYSYGFKSDDGIEREETGKLQEVFDEENKPHSVVFVRGSYTYINSEGKPETIVYEADDNGFRAFGDSIPKAPSRR